MTLTDFLLARIAEDERHARKLAESDHRPVLSLALTVNHPERILLECEAKRRIVEAAWHLESFDFTTDAYRHIVGKQREIMQALALPYADHDDYDETWRP